MFLSKPGGRKMGNPEKTTNVSELEKNIYKLVSYGLAKGLVREEDITYTINALADLFGEEELTGRFEQTEELNLHEILEELCKEARKKGIIKEDGITYSDLFDTKVMGLLTPKPSEVIDEFEKRRAQSSKAATDYFYELEKDVNYIRTDRMVKDEKWVTDTEYGPIDISINLAKPEKDPKAIAAAGQQKKSGYPSCLLCRENEGYAGHISHPARQNHRLIPVTLGGEDYFLQYSPYVYYNEHCIVLNKKHIPMVIDRAVFTKLFDFLDLFPHYIVGSNADLPIVGGSILSHDHFQGGGFTFAMAKADYETVFAMKDYPDVKAGRIKWPMSVIRLQGNNRQQMEEACYDILCKWREYSDESAGIYSHGVQDGEKVPHNTITPIARMRDGLYEIDLVLRNNRTDEEHPWGIFHPTADLHHIKKENIGLIEVMGLAILPSRLKKELAKAEEILLSGGDIEAKLRADGLTEKHADWVMEWYPEYDKLTAENIHGIVQDEVGKVFVKVLECAGVYKRDEAGFAAFERFTDTL